MVPMRRRPPRLSGGGLGGPKAKEAPSPQRPGPRWSQSQGGPLASAEGASMVPKRRRPPRLSGGGLGGPKAKETPSPQRRGPQWSQSEGGPLASAAGASMVRKPSVGEGKIPDEPTGRPYPPAAQAGPEGLGCNRRCVGEGKNFLTNPRGVPIPPRPRLDSGVTAAVWGKEKYLTNPRGVAIPPRPG